MFTYVSIMGSIGRSPCHALALFHERRIDEAMPLLLASMRSHPGDYVSLEHVAAGFSMAARRLSTIEGTNDQERSALQKAVRAFARAHAARQKSSGHTHECSEYEHPRTQVFRTWGDNLAWLGQRTEAMSVFEASNLWVDPLCRPHRQLPTRALGARRLPYIYDADDLFTHVSQPITTELVPLLAMLASTRTSRPSDWTAEAAGLHSTRSWHVVVLWVDGRPGPACTGKGTYYGPACRVLLRLMAEIPALNVLDGQIKLSSMAPGTRVRPHAGPTNARLRMHCSVSVPRNRKTAITVGTQSTGWELHQCFVFREECQHEVEIGVSAESNRTVLIVDFANPFLRSLDLYKSTLRVWPCDEAEGSTRSSCAANDAQREYEAFSQRLQLRTASTRKAA